MRFVIHSYPVTSSTRLHFLSIFPYIFCFIFICHFLPFEGRLQMIDWWQDHNNSGCFLFFICASSSSKPLHRKNPLTQTFLEGELYAFFGRQLPLSGWPHNPTIWLWFRTYPRGHSSFRLRPGCSPLTCVTVSLTVHVHICPVIGQFVNSKSKT